MSTGERSKRVLHINRLFDEIEAELKGANGPRTLAEKHDQIIYEELFLAYLREHGLSNIQLRVLESLHERVTG